jgi:TM2 domain-containing membrane protein YozV
VPGLGQLYLGRPLKALLFLAAILPTFLVGWALTDLTAVDPQRFRLDFAGQVFLGLPTFGALVMGADRVLASMPPFFEVGRLYVLVAGLLNLVAVCDAVGDGIHRDREVLAARLAHREARIPPRTAVDEAAPEPEAALEPTRPAGEDPA